MWFLGVQCRLGCGVCVFIGWIGVVCRMRLPLPRVVKFWSLTMLREELFKTGAKGIHHVKHVTAQAFEVAVSRLGSVASAALWLFFGPGEVVVALLARGVVRIGNKSNKGVESHLPDR